MHGHSNDYRTVKQYVKNCGFTPRILIEEYAADTIFSNLRKLIWDDVHCVVIILTQDDQMNNGNKRARQNVVFELGYCFGAFDSLDEDEIFQPEDALVVIAEQGVELFADIDGLTRIVYEPNKIEDKQDFIINALNASYKKAKKFYDI